MIQTDKFGEKEVELFDIKWYTWYVKFHKTLKLLELIDLRAHTYFWNASMFTW